MRNTYRDRTGVSLNLEQQLTETMGMFLRAGWADGNIEPWDFTDVDRTVSGGVAINGKTWDGRTTRSALPASSMVSPPTTKPISLPAALASSSATARCRTTASNRSSRLITAMPSRTTTKVTFDYQFIANPGYNADRGPVNAFAGRFHSTF